MYDIHQRFKTNLHKEIKISARLIMETQIRQTRNQLPMDLTNRHLKSKTNLLG